ncbi:hypothetical protein SUGI_1009340 [Cryptomeria japonica]|nr:hypothetical protein SUGI_1009340 [Cryptomeria japonica]
MEGKEDLRHNQGEVEHKEYAYEEDDECFYDSDELEEENQMTDLSEEHHKKKINIFIVLKEEDIRKHQEEGMESVCSIVSISKDEVVILFLHFG